MISLLFIRTFSLGEMVLEYFMAQIPMQILGIFFKDAPRGPKGGTRDFAALKKEWDTTAVS